ncbi:MAG: L,D-transpeptidase [Clostridiales bacterium]|nr:L,D-transpeptidase [Clostridiales bacterium]
MRNRRTRKKSRSAWRSICLFALLLAMLGTELYIAGRTPSHAEKDIQGEMSEAQQKEDEQNHWAESPSLPSNNPQKEGTSSQQGDPAEEPQETPSTTDDDSHYYIKVNNTANVVNVYKEDEQGQFTVPERAMICSTGTDTPTSGVYYLWGNGKWEWLGLFDDVFGQYCTQITGDILFHSVPYLTKGDKSSLEYWEFATLGTAASLGCVRLQVKDALWIYEHMDDIEAVEFYEDNDPGPLGKPDAPQISGNRDCRNWDPTDPDDRNPWGNAGNKTAT